MKNYILYILIIGSIIGLAFVYIGYKKTSNHSNGLLFQKSDTGIIRLIKEEGFVTWKKEGDKEYIRVEQEETIIPNNAYVKTADGRGYVILPDDSSIALNRNTEILISYSPKNVSIIQLLGTTYHRVMSLSTGSSYEVKTTGTLAAVRGTKFAVMYDEKNKKTNVVVTEHAVDVSVLNETKNQTKENARKVIEGETVTVKEEEVNNEGESIAPQVGQVTRLSTSSEPIKPRTREFRMYVDSQKEKASMKSWVDENKKIDEVFDVKRNKSQFIMDVVREMSIETKLDAQSGQGVARVAQPEEKKEITRSRSIDKALNTLKNRKEVISDDLLKKEAYDTKEPIPTPIITREPVVDSNIKPSTITVPVVRPVTVQEAPVLKEYNPNKEVLSTEEQAFIDNFYAAYELYLFADEKGLVCRNTQGLSAKDIIGRLDALTVKAGYILPHKDALMSLAQSIVTACEEGTILLNARELQTKFDVTYPYSG